MITQDILEKLDKASHSEIYDCEDGDFVYETAETSDSIDHFKENSISWNEKGRFFTGSLGEFAYIGWEQVQTKRGEMRNPITIIDLGEKRIAFRQDIRDLI
jgi:hypothetical protein